MTAVPAKKRPARKRPKKSAGADLRAIFDEIASLLAKHSPAFHGYSGGVKDKRDYHLVTTKKAVIAGRKYDRLSFASVIQQGDFVGFYFMPIYGEPRSKEKLAPELLKLLKGKSCDGELCASDDKQIDGTATTQISIA